MKIFNTLTMHKDEFVPLEPGKVRMYVCGPTVYNLIHIGNARPMIVFDAVRRYLEHKGYEVNFVSNFTDVDDKIIKAAVEEGVPAAVISERYIEECKKDMAALKVRPATTHPQATKEIGGMIRMILDLIKRDLKVSGEDEKEDPLDFVLWKPKKEGEPAWPSPWGEGRPGWHIECSVMSKKYLGETIDIHAGGEDLIFPHHENEIAQSECCSGKPFARYWMHNGFLNIDNQKMSKSLGNFFTVRDILGKYDAEVLRFFMLSSHYRSPLNFSAALMSSAANALDRIRRASSRLHDIVLKANAGEPDAEKLAAITAFTDKFDEKMDDDMNTADAISVIFDLVRYVNTEVSDDAPKALAQAAFDELELLCGILGLTAYIEEEEVDEEIDALIAERQAARKAKNFARADEIRDELKARGIELMDTKEGVKWKRI